MFDAHVCAQLSKGRARVISKYQINTVLSERGSLIIYLDKVTPSRCTFSFPALFPSVLIIVPPAGFSYTTRRNHIQGPSEVQSRHFAAGRRVCLRVLRPWVFLKTEILLHPVGSAFAACKRNFPTRFQRRRVWSSTTLRGQLDCCCASAGMRNVHVLKVNRRTPPGAKPAQHPPPCECVHPLSSGKPQISNHVENFLPENCSMQKKDKISDDERTAMTCDTSVNSKTDFGKQA